MNSRYVFPVLRVIVLVVAAGLILNNARTYLFEWFGWSIPPNVYGIVGLVLFWIVVSTSTKQVVDMLKVDADLERSTPSIPLAPDGRPASSAQAKQGQRRRRVRKHSR